MGTLTMDFPETALAALRCTREELASEMRLEAAASWYERGKLSQEMAARVAGMNRTDFLLALARLSKDSFQVDLADLDRELSRG